MSDLIGGFRMELTMEELIAEEKRRDAMAPPQQDRTGHCPICSLDYESARLMTGRRERSDHCAWCELEEEGMSLPSSKTQGREWIIKAGHS
jgi:hypothetical protein